MTGNNRRFQACRCRPVRGAAGLIRHLREVPSPGVPNLRLLREGWGPGTWGRGRRAPAFCFGASLGAQIVKNLPANAGDPVNLDQEDPLDTGPGEGAWRPGERGAGTDYGVTQSRTRLK